MTRRRIELVGPRTAEIAGSLLRSIALSTAVVGLLAAAGAVLAVSRLRR